MALCEFNLETDFNWPGIELIYWSNNGHGNGLFIAQPVEAITEYFIWGINDSGLVSFQIIKDFDAPKITENSMYQHLHQISGPHPSLDSAKVAYRMILAKYNAT